jgi:capsular exopolysaccharide synthesis family protein
LTAPVHPAPTDGADARDIVRLLRRRGWIILACVILIPVGVYEITASRPKIFQASTILQVQGGVDSGLGSDLSAPATNINAVASYVGTTAVAQEAARRLKLPISEVAGKAQATASEDTGFLTISATAPTAQGAQNIANAYAAALNATREKRGVNRINDAIRTAQDNLKKTPKSDIVTRQQLGTQLQNLQTLKNAQSQNVQVLQPAEGAAQIAPHPRRNATVAILLALLIGAALVLVSERFDRRLRRPEDLERLTGLPFLATIPHEAFPGEEDDPEVPEAFQTLRNTLTYFNTDVPLKSLVVTSALKGEGKTTVAANLAIAYASFGKRVIVVDTDLRKPDLAGRLGLEDKPGLSDVLSGSVSLHEAFKQVPPYGNGLRLLPAGGIPPNPSALLGSLRMASLLEELMADADLVVIDTTPLLMVSDAFPLLNKVSGIVALARLDKTPRDAVRRMAQIMTSAGGRVLGLVATDAKREALGGYGYGYGYGYGAEGKRRGRGNGRKDEAEVPEPGSAVQQ